jgi:glycosyltransferase involved in cell wall biosynthesis
MISIVIPAYNAEKTIAACLDSLLAQAEPRDEYDIIVVDDGSTDATCEIAQARGVWVLTQANRGASAARNLGAQNARGEIVLFIDADCVADSRWIEAMTAPFTDPAIVGVGGMKRTHQRGIVPTFIQMEFDYRYDQVSRHCYIDFIDSGTAAYRRDIFLNCGGFDTHLADAEDVDLSYRLSERGDRMAFAADAVVFHQHPESLLVYLRRKFMYAYWRSLVYGRHPAKLASDTRTPQSQRAQGVLAALLLASVPLIPFFPFAFLFFAFAFVLTTGPFVGRYFSRDWRAALLAPFLLLGAAYVGDAGVLLGALRRQATEDTGDTEKIRNPKSEI